MPSPPASGLGGLCVLPGGGPAAQHPHSHSQRSLDWHCHLPTPYAGQAERPPHHLAPISAGPYLFNILPLISKRQLSQVAHLPAHPHNTLNSIIQLIDAALLRTGKTPAEQHWPLCQYLADRSAKQPTLRARSRLLPARLVFSRLGPTPLNLCCPHVHVRTRSRTHWPTQMQTQRRRTLHIL